MMIAPTCSSSSRSSSSQHSQSQCVTHQVPDSKQDAAQPVDEHAVAQSADVYYTLQRDIQ
jgi:hypothetical protein